MIKAKLTKTKSGRPTIVLGLEPENIERMKKGNPVFINGTELGLAEDILVITGTMDEMTDALGLDRQPAPKPTVKH